MRNTVLPSRRGKHWRALLEPHWAELARRYVEDDTQRRVDLALEALAGLVPGDANAAPRTIDADVVRRFEALFDRLGQRGSPALRRTLDLLRKDLRAARGKSLHTVLQEPPD